MSERPYLERRSPSFFWPIVLIGAVVILLLYNLGMLRVDPWPVLFRFWPVILIIIGVDIIFGRRGTAGAVIGALLGLLLVGGVIAILIFAPALASSYPSMFGPMNIGEFGGPTTPLQTAQISHPLSDAAQAQVTLDFPAGNG